MILSLEKHWPLISILLLVALLASLCLWPEMQGLISLGIIVLSVGMLIAFTIHRRLEGSKQGALDHSVLWGMIILDVVGILLVLGLAMFVGRIVSEVVGMAVYSALLASAPEWAGVAAIVSGLLAALAAGLGVGWLVRAGWGMLEKLIFEKQADTSTT